MQPTHQKQRTALKIGMQKRSRVNFDVSPSWETMTNPNSKTAILRVSRHPAAYCTHNQYNCVSYMPQTFLLTPIHTTCGKPAMTAPCEMKQQRTRGWPQSSPFQFWPQRTRLQVRDKTHVIRPLLAFRQATMYSACGQHVQSIPTHIMLSASNFVSISCKREASKGLPQGCHTDCRKALHITCHPPPTQSDAHLQANAGCEAGFAPASAK